MPDDRAQAVVVALLLMVNVYVLPVPVYEYVIDPVVVSPGVSSVSE